MSRKVKLEQTEAEKTLLGISNEQWGQYEGLFEPLEDSWLEDIQQREADRQEGADIMGAEAAHKYGQFEQGLYDQGFANGLAPSSGAFLGLASDLASEKANAASSGMTSARNAETLDYYNNGLKALQYGQGIGSAGITGTYASGIRDIAADRMERNQNEFNRSMADQTRYSLYGLPGAVAGGVTAGLMATSKGGNPIRVQGPEGATMKGDFYSNLENSSPWLSQIGNIEY